MTDERIPFTLEEHELDTRLGSGKLTGDELQEFLSRYADVRINTSLPENSPPVIAFYCEGMINKVELNEYIQTAQAYAAAPEASSAFLLPAVSAVSLTEQWMDKLFSGSLLLYRVGDPAFYALDLLDIPHRKPSESNTEISLKGPKDAFTEEIMTNIALIRKRIGASSLLCETFRLGSTTRTEVGLLYLSDRAAPSLLDEVRKRIVQLEAESVLSSGQLEQWLADRTFSLFPLFDYIARPDFAAECLLRGRFIILVNGSPVVLIGPINATELLKSPEDVHFPYYYVMLQRGLRLAGFLTTILLPGFWVSVSAVNVSQLPFQLLATVVVSRNGIPFPLAMEAIILILLFELLREAGARLPKWVGQTVGIVGGIIIGEAAVQAGLASPTLIVIIAISAVSTFVLVNQSLVGTAAILRLYILLVSSLLGVYGFFLAAFSVLVYVCRLESFGIAYLEPIVSLRWREWLAAFLTDPFRRKRYSVSFLRNRRGEP